jgi:hypothetical protein
MRYIKGFIAAAACFIILSSSSHAGVKFVSPTGDDAVSAATNDIDHPWKTAAKAFTDAAAGDTVYFRAGTYEVTKTINIDGGNVRPVLLTCYNNETVLITGIGADPIFEIQRQSYTVDGISFTGRGTCFRVGWDRNGSNFAVRNCSYTMKNGGDNNGFVYANGLLANGTRVENCTLIGPGSHAHQNSAGVIAFRTQQLSILHCEISEFPIAIYYKHANDIDAVTNGTAIEIAHNYIHGTSRYAMEINANHARIHDNLFGLNNAGIRFNECNGAAGGDCNLFTHNTLYKTPLNLSGETDAHDRSYPGAVGNTISDNIIYGESDPEHKIFDIYRYFTHGDHKTVSDYNCLYNSATSNVIAEFGKPYTLSAWSTHGGGDAHSVQLRPAFTNASGQLDTATDFRLTAASPGYRAASDGTDMGANVDSVGVKSGEMKTPQPGTSKP